MALEKAYQGSFTKDYSKPCELKVFLAGITISFFLVEGMEA